MERRYRYKEIQELADRLGPFLSLCQQVWQCRSIGEGIIKANAQALALLLPDAGEVIQDWLRQLERLKMDLSYRDRALRAERALRQFKRTGGK